MLQLILSPILAAIRWLGVTVAPWLMQGLVAKILVSLGISIVSAGAVLVAFNTLLGIAVDQVAAISSAHAAAFQLAALFGVFKALSLIASTALAKATWLAARPTLGLFNNNQ